MKSAMAGFILSVPVLAGYGAEQSGEPAQDAPAYTSAVSAGDCFLCSSGAGESFHWGEPEEAGDPLKTDILVFYCPLG